MLKRAVSLALALILLITPMAVFADHDPVVIHGTVFRDEDGNGILDTEDVGLEGVTVSLFESDGTTLVDFDITDIDGGYDFQDLVSESYVLEVEVLVGYADSTPNPVPFVVDETTILPIVDFGKEPLPIGSISGTVFDDLERDGFYDLGEDDPLEGVLVTLYSSEGDPFTEVTDASGEYRFSDLLPGAYTLVETDPETYYSTTPNTVMVDLPTELSMDVIIDFGDFIPEEGEFPKLDLILMKFFDISLLEFQALREMEGFGYGNIAKAYFIAMLSDTALVDILGMRETMGWGNIMKEVLGYAGLKGYNLGLIVSGREVPNSVQKLIDSCGIIDSPEQVHELYATGASHGAIKKACRLATEAGGGFDTLVTAIGLLKVHNQKQVREILMDGAANQVTDSRHGPPACKGKNKNDEGCN